MSTKLLSPDALEVAPITNISESVEFTMKDLQPDMTTFGSRVKHMFTLNNPRLFFVKD